MRRHIGRGEPVGLHPEAMAFAAHYGFAPRVCWPERPQSKGRVERVVPLTREKVLAGRDLATLEDRLLCAMVKKAHGASPCRLFCLDPIEGMVRGIEPGARLEVEETLYEGQRCRVRLLL